MGGRVPGGSNEQQTYYIVKNTGTGVKPDFCFRKAKSFCHNGIYCSGKAVYTGKDRTYCQKNAAGFPDRDIQAFVIDQHQHQQSGKKH